MFSKGAKNRRLFFLLSVFCSLLAFQPVAMADPEPNCYLPACLDFRAYLGPYPNNPWEPPANWVTPSKDDNYFGFPSGCSHTHANNPAVFAFVAALESQVLAQYGFAADLSEQDIISCDTLWGGPDGSISVEGHWTPPYLGQWLTTVGVDLTVYHHYTGYNNQNDCPYCSGVNTCNANQNQNFKAGTVTQVAVAPRNDNTTTRLDRINDLKGLLNGTSNNSGGAGPIVASFRVYDDLHNCMEACSTGAYILTNASKLVDGSKYVLLIGYKDTGPGATDGYFIAKNSWGAGWTPSVYSGYGDGCFKID